MTDSDINALNEGIYGGQRLSNQALERILAVYAWSSAGTLIADKPDQFPDAPHLPLADDLHLYALSGGEVYTEPSEFWGAAQRAIVARRLSLLRERGWTPYKGDAWAYEQGLRGLALHTYRRQEQDWEQAVELWFLACSGRHYIKLDRFRRKVIEFLMLITADIDSDETIDGGIRHAITRINTAHVLASIEQVCMQTLLWLQPSISILHATTAAPSFVVAAMRFMQQRFDQALTVADVATSVGVSREHLMRAFKRTYAVTMQHYLTQLRVDYAQGLLRETDDSLMSIALDCGFASQEQLHRAFKKICQTTPQRYRRKHQGR